MVYADYDLVVIGGGLGGAAIGKALAEHGARVLILECEKQFHDRIRGEGLTPWGGAEAQRLGIYQMLVDSCAYEKPRMISLGLERDLVATTQHKLPLLSFYHPEMQEVLFQAAAKAGAEVRRGVFLNGSARCPSARLLPRTQRQPQKPVTDSWRQTLPSRWRLSYGVCSSISSMGRVTLCTLGSLRRARLSSVNERI